MPKITKLQDRALLRISGQDNRKLLQGLITNNIDRITPDACIFAALLTPQGKFLHDFFLFQDGDDLMMDVLVDRLPDLLKRLKMYRLRAKVDFSDETKDWQVIVAFGEESTGTPGQITPVDSGQKTIDPRHTDIGARYWLSSSADIPEGDNAPVEEWQKHLIALGIPSAGTDLIVDKTLMLEAGYEELNAIDFRKGCYVGQEITARSKYRANIRKRLLHIESDQDLPMEGVITCNDKHAGDLRSVNGKEAIAFMRLEYMDSDSLLIEDQPVRINKPAWVVIPEKKDA